MCVCDANFVGIFTVSSQKSHILVMMTCFVLSFLCGGAYVIYSRKGILMHYLLVWLCVVVCVFVDLNTL